MSSLTGKNKLLSLRSRWRAEGFAYCLLLSLAVSLPVTLLLKIFFGWPLLTGFVVLIVALTAVCWRLPLWRISLSDVARLLDRRLPELQESCGLLLRLPADLGVLERLQAARTETVLAELSLPHPLRSRLWKAFLFLILAVLLYGVLTLILAESKSVGRTGNLPALLNKMPATTLPEIRSVHIRIAPPVYTGKALRRQEVFNLRAEEGSQLTWEIQTNITVHTLQFIFNDSLTLPLRSVDNDGNHWQLNLPARRSGFYRFLVDGRPSGLYPLEVVKDEAPRIVIRTPKPYVVIDYGEPTKIPLFVTLIDDYGIADASVEATLASGSGEAVKFNQRTIRFARPFAGDQPALDLRQTLDLPSLGLKPGDELYFYVRAKDTHGQEARTDMYILSLADTAQLMSLQGMTMGVDLKPEYFRSERQIILETEQLLKEKDTLPVQAFNSRSNDLGIDQKLLRLRYGKFLGEESEESGPGHLSRDAEKPGDVGDARSILDAYTDKHDNAEDATYFEPAVKEQLKATLTEMWAAELRLRTFKPQEALPFAYKALRLLKDLQQKSRAFVAKTGVRVTPLDPAKRLSGKLDQIGPEVQRSEFLTGTVPSPEQVLRISLSLLESSAQSDGAGSRLILQQAAQQLGRAASEHPMEYLPGYQALQKILQAGVRDGTDRLSAQRAIRNLLPETAAIPSASRMSPDGGLSGFYFTRLAAAAKKP